MAYPRLRIICELDRLWGRANRNEKAATHRLEVNYQRALKDGIERAKRVVLKAFEPD